MIAAGVGFRGSASAEDIAALVRQAAARAGVAISDIAALATGVSRAGMAPFAGAADLLGLAPVAVEDERLPTAEPRLLTRSPRVLASHGVGSVAEAAALCAAGPDARLLLARIAGARVTCALAEGAGP